jgi:hypothetical protein
LDFWDRHEQLVQLLLMEDLQRGVHLQAEAEALRSALLEPLCDICRRGEAEGVMRPGVDALDLYMTIAAMAVFRVASGGSALASAGAGPRLPLCEAQFRRLAVETILRSVVNTSDRPRSARGREAGAARLGRS